MKSLGCLFLPMAMPSIAITQIFLSRRKSRKKHYSLLDIGRARTLAEGLGLAKGTKCALPEQTFDDRRLPRKLNSTILFYSLGPKKSWLWAITPHRTRLFPLPAQAGIETQVHGYQNAILNRPTHCASKPGREKSLRDPRRAGRSNDPKGSKVLIIPDGILNGLISRPCLPRRRTAHTIGSKM